jgi:hypothetical protein
MNAKKGRAVQTEMRPIARALRQIWDPIGMGKIPNLPADEYSSYAPRVMSLFGGGASDREIATYLAEVEGQQMRLKPRLISELESVAARLREAIMPGARAT